jgi:hypothetical protein
MYNNKYDLSGKAVKSYGNVAVGCPITMDLGGFNVYYRNNLGGARKAFLKTRDHNEARNETLNIHGGQIDESPARIERFDTFGNHTHTWTTDNIWDSALRLQARLV